MKRKLLWLNVLLIGLIGWIVYLLRVEWRAARLREAAVLKQPVKTAAAPPVAKTPAPAPVRAEGYFDVATNLLFSKDRNPNVVVAAPPPKVQPPLPKFYGVMNLGDGPMAILSEPNGRSQKPYMVGDKIGDYKLAGIGAENLIFEWDGKQIPKKMSELQEKSGEKQGGEEAPSRPATAPAAPVTPAPATPGPGVDMGGGLSACNAGDASPAGTVVNGMRKVVTETPFAKVCRWEPVK